MRISVISHCAVDDIRLMGAAHQQAGGDASYTALTAREFRASVSLQTRFGPDFPVAYLRDAGIGYPREAASDTPTTRFRIEIDGQHRELYLLAECDPISVQESSSQDATITTPIYHEISPGEISPPGDPGYLLLNPQGLLREAEDNGRIRTVETGLDMSGVDAIKVNPTEIRALTGLDGDEGMAALQKKGVGTVIRTDGKDISMLAGGMVYAIRLPNREVYDTTGLGAILCGAFVCTMLKERDVLWAFCFAGGAVQAALESKSLGLLKVPKSGAVQTNASYFYNLVKYRQI